MIKVRESTGWLCVRQLGYPDRWYRRPDRCQKCGDRSLYMEAWDEDYAFRPKFFYLKCLSCGALTPTARAYHTRRHYHDKHGMDYADIDRVAHGESNFVWEVPA